MVPAEYTRHGDGSFVAIYNLTTTGAEGGTVASMSGGYHVRFGNTAESADGWARAAEKLAIRPVDCYTEWEHSPSGGRTVRNCGDHGFPSMVSKGENQSRPLCAAYSSLGTATAGHRL